ncbi:MAG: hypothetical protein L6Q59_00915 [Ignavibacteriaceae bacterium]|nr:hypothetical protein [Ignavibacteriaceae bacterium]
MKRIILILSILLLTVPGLKGQWRQTSGPEGGYFNTVYKYNNKLYAVTVNGRIFERQSDDAWSFYSNGEYDIERVYQIGGKLIGATSSGLAVSEDGGLNWTPVITNGFNFTETISNGKIYISVNDSVFIFNPQTNGLDTSGIKTSMTILLNGQPAEVDFFGISSILINNNRVIIFAMIPQIAGMTGIFYSDDNGRNWIQAQGIENEFGSRELLMINGTMYLNTFSGLYKSTDNGENWSTETNGFPAGQTPGFLTITAMNNELYGVAVLNSQYGVWKLTSGTWSAVETEKNVFRLSAAGNKLYGMSQSSIIEYQNTPGNWNSVDDGLIATTSSLYLINDNLVFAGYSSDNWMTTDKGSTWLKTDFEYRGFTAAGNKVFAWGENGIVVSEDGVNWSSSSNGIPQSLRQYITSLANINGVLYAGISKVRARMHLPPVWEAGGFYRSADNGLSWQYFAAGLPAEAGIHAPVYRIFGTTQGIIAHTNGGTFLKSDNENSMRQITGLQTNEGVYDAKVYDGKLFIQTFTGIKASTDFGLNWEQVNTGLPSETFFYVSAKLFVYNGRLLIMSNQADNIVYELNGSTWVVSEIPAPQNIVVNRIETSGEYIMASTLERGVWIFSPVSDIEKDEVTVSEYALNQNYPNPFNPSTTISFTLKEDAQVTMQIFTANGELAAELTSGYMTRGNHRVVWNAQDMTSGVYITVLNISEAATGRNIRLSNKMILMK